MSDTPDQVMELEMKLAFLERTVEVLNEVILEQGTQLQSISLRIEKMESQARSAGASSPETLRPHDDPPPHY
jgi:uncharacterized coiled-coil protein SlyX